MAIEWFQRELNKRGAGLTVDGKLGPKTKSAFKAALVAVPKSTPVYPKKTAPSKKLDARTERNLKGVNPALIKVYREARIRSGKNFIVTEGVRSQARQIKLYKAGKSWTLNSYHKTGDAIDVALIEGRKAIWTAREYNAFAKIMYTVAREMKVPLKWGGEWKSRDRPHFQTKRRRR